ncbi:phosphorylcholine phosphatase [Streptomyces spiroverticillatus]|uniref:Phosphorylcholine phosphatase n=1 Tax=Streptomyces finlayi TaxID=67296 RepID=A0A918X2R6_9ACTN|nr:HAD family hydrolase [Streptomyces finlayi]GHA23759.1 phosphorylcholine phosphatase [Streptomyces spiroverticillatus]GHD04926.1 phosphorylcholine phosphatase [Streptomyces finlayi]
MTTPPTKRKKPLLLTAAAALTAAVFATGALWPDTSAPAGDTTQQRAVAAELKHWPAPEAKRLGKLIAAQEHKGAYAVFDADNTTYQNDLEESLLPFLEMKGVLTRDTMDPSLKIVPFKDTAGHKETLAEYYARLCEIDDQVSYPWAAQIFSGFTLKQLKGYVDELLAYEGPLPGGVKPPKFSPGMQELYRSLSKHGITVYVVSAAHEDLVRMVLADPKHGYAVKPENVLGVSTLLKDRRTGQITSSRKEIAAGRFDQNRINSYELTPTLWAPATWYEGKPAAISTYIDPWRGPVLAAGDTPKSDGPMLLRSTDVAKGGLRVWVNRKDTYMKELNGMKAAGVKRQKELGQRPTADRNWLTVTPQQIG